MRRSIDIGLLFRYSLGLKKADRTAILIRGFEKVYDVMGRAQRQPLSLQSICHAGQDFTRVTMLSPPSLVPVDIQTGED